jgi:hypothetical protein
VFLFLLLLFFFFAVYTVLTAVYVLMYCHLPFAHVSTSHEG